MWVADMDFRSPPAVIDALKARVEHGVFGYTDAPDELHEVTMAYLEDHYGWKVEREWILWLPGLVSGLNVVARALCDPDQEAITATPIYPPFLSAPANQERQVVRVPLLEEGGRWHWDLERLDATITKRSNLLLHCNPHNPVGRVFTERELLDLALRCTRNDLFLCSDEIHCGLVLDGDKAHFPIARLSPEIAGRTVTLMSASKTFNLPGLGCAFAIASSPELRAKLKRAAAGIVPRVPTFGHIGTLAAYRDGEPWRLALIDYLRGNRNLVLKSVGEMSGLSVFPVEATYLAWIDARSLPVKDPAKFFEQAGVGLYDGADFGTPGFLRLNFGCPRSLLRVALDRMAGAVRSF